MKLSILMAGLSTRQRPIEEQIKTQIYQQLSYRNIRETSHENIQGFHHEDVEFLRLIDNGELTSGQKRSLLTKAASGQYVCFIDDDDILSVDYVRQLYDASIKNPDVITFNLKMIRNGYERETWHFGLHPNLRAAGLMCVNHLCAWRKDLALQVNWDPLLGNSDDRLWFEPLYYKGVINTQYHINKVLYHYLYESNITVNQKTERILFTKQYFGHGLRCFLDKQTNEILIETSPRYIKAPTNPLPNSVLVRNSSNEYLYAPLNNLIHYHTVKP